MDGKWQSRQRVEQMERTFNSQIQLVSSLQSLLEQVETSQPEYLELLDYYQSSTYLEDMDMADRGELKDLPCGVLSEDGVYNLLVDRKELTKMMKKCIHLLEI